jgi:tRNA(Ile)-lysidine synthase
MTLTFEQFAQAMTPFGLAPGARIAVGVSGGGDSMALALLLKEWGADVLALTVDHGLRAGSAAEALRVHDILSARDIAHDILMWEGMKPQTGVQEKARAARHDLLLSACRARGIEYLALAHNAEDQAETFWMRLAAGSGLDGLACMAPEREVDGVTIIRPVLSFSRAELRDACRARGVEWIEDPSNENEKFLRVRLRGFEEMLAAEGLTPQRLARTVRKLALAQEALTEVTDRALEQALRLEDGAACLDAALWRAQPEDIRLRMASRALNLVRPQDYPPEFTALEALCAAMLAPGFRGRTLAGCKISARKGEIVFERETAERRAS